jgi:signal transduction histidine kinase
MHRGQISVQSKVGLGTTFTVTLPVCLPSGGRATTEVSSSMIG